MEDDLIEILSDFGFPVFRQGSLTDTDAYPDSFLHSGTMTVRITHTMMGMSMVPNGILT